jgi:hypothetical protein
MDARQTALVACLCMAASGLLSNSAWGQSASKAPQDLAVNPIGKVMTVTGMAHIEHPATILVQASLPANPDAPTKVGDLVYRGDVIQTGVDGTIGIVFADGTSFNVSNNAKMEVNDFVYDPNGHSNSSLMSLTKGTFTFIAGNVAHTGDMKVDTPVGTMGIRGTAPRVEILDDGTVKFSTLVEQKK